MCLKTGEKIKINPAFAFFIGVLVSVAVQVFFPYIMLSCGWPISTSLLEEKYENSFLNFKMDELQKTITLRNDGFSDIIGIEIWVTPYDVVSEVDKTTGLVYPHQDIEHNTAVNQPIVGNFTLGRGEVKNIDLKLFKNFLSFIPQGDFQKVDKVEYCVRIKYLNPFSGKKYVKFYFSSQRISLQGIHELMGWTGGFEPTQTLYKQRKKMILDQMIRFGDKKEEIQEELLD